MAEFFARGVRGDPRFAAQFRHYYERDVLPARAATWRREEIIATALEVAPILQQAWNGFAKADSDLRYLVPKVTCPILLAWATGDRYVAWSRSKRAALKFPNPQVRLFDGGHSAFLEEPSAFIEALKEFIATSSPGAEAPKISAKLGAACCD
jgi:pimeloyl-ACP methyl ester carboxylesterase